MATKLKTVEQALDDLPGNPALNIAQRINAAMAEVDYVQKTQPKDGGMKYSFVSHDAVTSKVRPILQRHGVVYYPREMHVTQSGNRTEAVFIVRFENIDNRDDYIDVATFGYGVDGQDKGPGKAMSYGVKYALLKVLGLETGDDPEEDQGPSADYKPDRITQEQFEEIRALLPKAGRTVDNICAGYKVKELVELSQSDAEKALERLRKLAMEPANA